VTSRIKPQSANVALTATRPESFSGCVSIELEGEEDEDEEEDGTGASGLSDGPACDVVPRFVLGVGVCCVETRSIVERPVLDGFVEARELAESPSMTV
jgi:hypothetical protein